MTIGLKRGAQAAALAVVAALLALLVWKVASGNGGGAAAELAKGKQPPAPGFTLSRIDGDGKLSLASLRGKVVVLNFWASWCVPCKKEAPLLQAAAERWAGKGVVVVGVDAQDFVGDARHFARKHGVRYPLVHDGAGKLMGPYGVTGFPETFFVDRRGHLVGERVAGEISADDLESGIRAALSS